MKMEYTISDLIRENDAVRRNEIALEISKSGQIEVREALFQIIFSGELDNSRGTLVHCLQNFDCSDKMDSLAELVVSGNWEVAHEAYQIMSDISYSDDDSVNTAYNILKKFQIQSSEDEWRFNLVTSLISMYD
jgi:hypothetical protein